MHQCISQFFLQDGKANSERAFLGKKSDLSQVIIVDEIGSKAEAEVLRGIAHRGVAIVAIVHGQSLADVLENPSLEGLMGDKSTVTLGDITASQRCTITLPITCSLFFRKDPWAISRLHRDAQSPFPSPALSFFARIPGRSHRFTEVHNHPSHHLLLCPPETQPGMDLWRRECIAGLERKPINPNVAGFCLPGCVLLLGSAAWPE